MNSQPATAGELDCLTVLWQGKEDGIQAMQLGQIRERITDKRKMNGESTPAVTTVSTYLRNALHKGLIEEVRLDKNGAVSELPSNGAHRGVLRGVRSPNTAYRAAANPQDVFGDTLLAIADAYPLKERLLLLVHVAEALSVPKRVVSEIRKWVRTQSS